MNDSGKNEFMAVKMDTNEIEVREKYITYMVGAVVFCIGAGLLLLELIYHQGRVIPLWIYLVILAICLSGVCLFMQARNRKLLAAGINITYVNLLRMEKHFSLEEIGYVKAAENPSIGQDYMILYDKMGRKLCKLEFSMRNAHRFFLYLSDNRIEIDTSKDTSSFLQEAAMQEKIPAESVKKLANQAYDKTGLIIREWQERNKKIGADFAFGLVEYDGSKMENDAVIQPPESRLKVEDYTRLPNAYQCVMELYVKKGDCFIKDKKGNLVCLAFTVISMRESGADSGQYRLFYCGNYLNNIKTGLAELEHYLPEHRFVQERMELPYRLRQL